MHINETQTRIGWAWFVAGFLLVVLKLTGVIAWSWWWVLAPFWLPMALSLLILIGVVVGALIGETRR